MGKINAIKSEQDEEKKSDDVSMRREGLMQALFAFNDRIVKLTQDEKNDLSKALVAITDDLRDVVLPKYGVKIEDIEGGNGSIWKLYNAKVLMTLLSSAKNDKVNKKLQNKIRQLEKDLDNWRKKSMQPLEYFKSATDGDDMLLYSQFDDATGQPLSKSKLKKLPKAKKKQEKAYKQYLAKAEKNPTFLQDLESELNELKGQLSV